MNVIHILEDYSILSGGIRTVVKNLHENLIKNGHNSIILSPNCESNDLKVITYEIKNSNPWCYSLDLKKKLAGLHKKLDKAIIHIHGVWMFPQYYASKFALKKRIPFVVSFHGMYEPWLWKKSFLKKKIYSKFFTDKLYKRASIIHTITESETKDLSKRFKNANFFEIPNLINYALKDDSNENTNKSNYILFLSRLDPKKGIDLLIKAYQKLNQKTEVKLKIVGPFNAYKNLLTDLVKELQLTDDVEFIDTVKGSKKEKLYKQALVFVLPTHSEVIGMVNLEAASSGTLVITTKHTGLGNEWVNNGGILVNTNVEEIRASIENVLYLNDNERYIREQKLKRFVLKKYSWESRYKDWELLYKKAILNAKFTKTRII